MNDEAVQAWQFEEASDSSSEVYIVTWEQRSDGEVYSTCTCPAGMLGKWCKHRTRTMTKIPVDVHATSLGELIAEKEASDAKHKQLQNELKQGRKRELAALSRKMSPFLS
ncbi:MAG: hypothetical protein F4206_01120 [Gammaproteobacteria bacterium]|nr:hypothetical protein [Gammaproteobacteria bacterium]MYG65316.1 hypothetical protein [Gammaproteobacteria bacterium]